MCTDTCKKKKKTWVAPEKLTRPFPFMQDDKLADWRGLAQAFKVDCVKSGVCGGGEVTSSTSEMRWLPEAHWEHKGCSLKCERITESQLFLLAGAHHCPRQTSHTRIKIFFHMIAKILFNDIIIF